MSTLEIFQISFFLFLFFLSIFIAFGTNIWFNKTRPFSKLNETRIDDINKEKIDFTAYKEISIKEISEINKCGKKIVASQFMFKQLTSFTRKVWEDWIKAWAILALISLAILCFQLKNFQKDITFPEIIHFILGTVISTLISYGIVGYFLKVFFEFWLLKSQVHENEEVLNN